MHTRAEALGLEGEAGRTRGRRERCCNSRQARARKTRAGAPQFGSGFESPIGAVDLADAQATGLRADGQRGRTMCPPHRGPKDTLKLGSLARPGGGPAAAARAEPAREPRRRYWRAARGSRAREGRRAAFLLLRLLLAPVDGSIDGSIEGVGWSVLGAAMPSQTTARAVRSATPAVAGGAARLLPLLVIFGSGEAGPGQARRGSPPDRQLLSSPSCPVRIDVGLPAALALAWCGVWVQGSECVAHVASTWRRPSKRAGDPWDTIVLVDRRLVIIDSIDPPQHAPDLLACPRSTTNQHRYKARPPPRSSPHQPWPPTTRRAGKGTVCSARRSPD